MVKHYIMFMFYTMGLSLFIFASASSNSENNFPPWLALVIMGSFLAHLIWQMYSDRNTLTHLIGTKLHEAQAAEKAKNQLTDASIQPEALVDTGKSTVQQKRR